MRSLLDVNVIIALLDVDHSLHELATEWFSRYGHDGWASCPIVQNGCIRIMSHPGYPNPLTAKHVVERLRDATDNATHEFWADDISVLDASRFDATRIHGPRQLTDLYLLALAVHRGGRFVTFDASISTTAVSRFEPAHLLKL
jgi:toxin-antitoxin system PIN domain toxin